MKRSMIEQLLPAIFQRAVTPDTPLFALLVVMEQMHAPSEAILTDLGDYFNPYRAPDAFVPLLASWLDLERLLGKTPHTLDEQTVATLFPTGLGRLRELVASAAYLSKWRGTVRGLVLFLETATGLQPFVVDDEVIDEAGQKRPFHLLVRAPLAAKRYQVLVEHIIELEKPAYVTYELTFEEA